MNPHRLSWLIVFLMLIVLLGTAYQVPPQFPTDPITEAATTGPKKVALILQGRVNDPGYFNAGYQALLAVQKKYGAQTAYQENLIIADADRVLRTYGEQGFDYVIVMGGGTYDDAILKVVPDYPKMKFIIVSGNMTKLPNIISIVTGNPGVAYMAGALMAMISKTGKIGLIGGRASPPAVKDHVAVIAGAKYARPNIRILDVYTETYTEPTVGKQAAIAQIDAGVDMIFTNANNTAFGVFEACKERGILAVGAATDQNEVAPNTVLTSTVYGTDNGVLWIMDLDLRGKIEDKKVYTMSLDLVGLAPFHSLDSRVSKNIKDKVATIRQKLLKGELRVPESYKEVGMPGPGK